jgi:hypothetical protein
MGTAGAAQLAQVLERNSTLTLLNLLGTSNYGGVEGARDGGRRLCRVNTSSIHPPITTTTDQQALRIAQLGRQQRWSCRSRAVGTSIGVQLHPHLAQLVEYVQL